MKKRSVHPTLSQVARKAGVGTTTVSRVINGGDRVSPETLAHVHRVIEAMGYVPNQAARSLRGERAKTIGLVIPSIADPFFSSCAETIEDIAQANDSLLIVTVTHDDIQREAEKLNFLIRQRTDGLIVAPASSENVALSELFSRVAIPVVTIDRPVAKSNIPSVVATNYGGALAATKHLVEHGYRRILCLAGDSGLYTIRERIRGYRSAMKSAHLSCMLDTSTTTDYISVEYAIKKVLRSANSPDAIFALKNSITIHAFEALQRLRVDVPNSIALLGFDDFELADTLSPSISVVQQPIDEIGQIAAELLFNKLLDLRKSRTTVMPGGSQLIDVQTRLVLRRSCGCS